MSSQKTLTNTMMLTQLQDADLHTGQSYAPGESHRTLTQNTQVTSYSFTYFDQDYVWLKPLVIILCHY